MNTHIPIKQEDNIRPSAPKVTATTWVPGEGRRRSEQIKQAQIDGELERQKAMEEALPINVRVAALEGAVARLTQDIHKILHTLGVPNDATQR